MFNGNPRAMRVEQAAMERHNRFFVERIDGGTVELSVAEAHHAMHVMRLGRGDGVELFDGRGGLADGEIAEAKRGKVVVAVQSRRRAEDRPRPVIHLAFAVPKAKRLDWLLEKATELAAGSLTPVSFERSVVEPGELVGSKRDRWLGHCVSAAKQSGLNWLPELRGPMTLAEYLREFAAWGAVGLVGSAGPEAEAVRDALKPATDAESPQQPRDIRILIGPEGGLTEAEYAAATAAGFVRARLGSTTLRIETACIAMLAAAAAVAGR